MPPKQEHAFPGAVKPKNKQMLFSAHVNLFTAAGLLVHYDIMKSFSCYLLPTEL